MLKCLPHNCRVESEIPEHKETKNPGGEEAPGHEHKGYWNFSRIATLIGIIEGLSGIVWAKSFDFKPQAAYYIQWIAYCGMLAGVAFAAHRLTREKFRKVFICMIWIAWAGFCTLLLFARTNPESAQVAKEKATIWQPPELPPGCSNVIIWFGGDGKIYPVPVLSKYHYGPMLEQFPISEATPEEKRIMPTMPGFSPRAKTFSGQLITSSTVNGLPVDYPIIPRIISNRLFVYVKIPFLHEKQKIGMSDEMESVLTNCLPQTTNVWDWNFSRGTKTNVFEIVNGYKNPILQVIYKSANEVQVNGIFFVSKYDFAATFDSKRPAWFFGSTVPIQIVENQKTQTVTLPELQKRLTNVDLFFSAPAVYDELSTNQKAIFKYPSNIYPGEFAEENQTIEAFGSKMALLVGWMIVGFGFAWTFFGWIFFQKRSN